VGRRSPLFGTDTATEVWSAKQNP